MPSHLDLYAPSATRDASLDFLHPDAADPPVTVIREIRVRPGRLAAFEERMGDLLAEAARQPGHLGATVVRPDPRRPGDVVRFIYKFDRRSHLDAWHRSDARARLFAPIEALIESDRFDAYPGLETWFELPGPSTAPRWKMRLMSWAASVLRDARARLRGTHSDPRVGAHRNCRSPRGPTSSRPGSAACSTDGSTRDPVTRARRE